MSSPQIKSFTLGDFQTNCFVVTVPEAPHEDPATSKDCWVVDCGFDPDPLFRYIDAGGLVPKALLLTHAHADHIAGVDRLLAHFGDMPVYLHEAERGFCSDPMLNLSGLMGMQVTAREPDHWLRDGDELTLRDATFRIIHTPGHSPGGVLFVHDDSKQAIVGDTLFAGSIGRIDFPTSDPVQMRRSLFEIIMKLPDDMTIYPGHMGVTTIGQERRSNPFILGGF